MQEPQAPPPGRDAGIPPTEQIRPAGLFSDLKYTPDVPAPQPAAPADLAKRKKVFTRIVLPLLIFVAGIAVIAFVTQYLPNRINPDAAVPGEKLKLEFPNGTRHVWGYWIPGQGVRWG